MKKRNTLIALVLIVVLVVGIGASYAYFTATETATNTFTVGNVDIDLDEPNWEEPEDVLPGMQFDKDPTVENTGSVDCYVRMNVTVTDYAAFASEIPAGYDLTNIFGGFDASKWTLAGTPAVDGDTVTYSYYYNTVLEPEDKATLFTSVTVPDFLTETAIKAMDGSFDIIVKADAIQAEGFDTVAAAFAAFDSQNS